MHCRAAEIGLPIPGPRGRASSGRTVTTAAAAIAIVSLVAAIVIMLRVVKIPAIPKNGESLVAVVLLAVCWTSLAVVGFVLRKRGRGGPEEVARRLFFGGTVARSAFAVILLAATVLAIAGLPLRVAESRHVAAAVIEPDTGKPRLFLSELNPAWRDRRDAAVAQRSALLRESH
jgi:hypothetical protein